MVSVSDKQSSLNLLIQAPSQVFFTPGAPLQQGNKLKRPVTQKTGQNMYDISYAGITRQVKWVQVEPTLSNLLPRFYLLRIQFSTNNTSVQYFDKSFIKVVCNYIKLFIYLSLCNFSKIFLNKFNLLLIEQKSKSIL